MLANWVDCKWEKGLVCLKTEMEAGLYSEDLFQELLENRTKLSNKGKRVNTDIAIERLRKRLETFYHEGYDCDRIIETALENSWLSVFRPKDVEPKQRPLTVSGPLFNQVSQLREKMKVPEKRTPEYGRKAIEALRQVLNES